MCLPLESRKCNTFLALTSYSLRKSLFSSADSPLLLGRGLVYFLRNRSESQVETVLRLMLAKAASTSFDVIELRCDGEGAIGALTSTLQASGIVVNIAGPGQHVVVVERMARTLRGRYRCHELALPFVMTRILIV